MNKLTQEFYGLKKKFLKNFISFRFYGLKNLGELFDLSEQHEISWTTAPSLEK